LPVLAEGNLVRPGGREVGWATWGDPAGRPLLLLHGTPGSRLDRVPEPGFYERIRAHVLSFDRPGYGRSTAQRDRTIVSVAEDAVAIADELGWSRFAVLGVSGGGPHALALGARSPQRLVSLGLAVGSPPSELVDPNDLIAINREGLSRAQEGRAALEAFLAEPAAQLAADPAAALDSMMADAPEVDRELLASPQLRDMIAQSLREGFANGPAGWFDDAWCLSSTWGFALRDIALPVHMWYGEIDRNVPLKAVERMAAELNVALLELIPGGGHLSWLAQAQSVHETLLAAPSPHAGDRRKSPQGA
jgi:pimeloyl-ACP methyl ester carboxylesterase